jgi:hypothetical protein
MVKFATQFIDRLREDLKLNFIYFSRLEYFLKYIFKNCRRQRLEKKPGICSPAQVFGKTRTER